MATPSRPRHGMDLMIAVAPHRPLPDMHGPDEPDADDQGGPPDSDADDQSPQPQGQMAIKPEWVDYGESHCAGCEYIDQENNCSVLNMPVNPDIGHCTAYEPAQGEQGAGGGSAEMGGGGGVEDQGGGEPSEYASQAQ